MLYVARMLLPAHRPGPRSLGLGPVVLLGALLAGCFSKPPPPPGFRTTCAEDGECADGEECVQGLCQIPCSSADPDRACPDGAGVCFNGACSDICLLEDSRCSDPMECLEFPVEANEFTGLSEGSGICGILCDESDPSTCPEGELCVLGFCVDPGSLSTGGDSDGPGDGSGTGPDGTGTGSDTGDSGDTDAGDTTP